MKIQYLLCEGGKLIPCPKEYAEFVSIESFNDLLEKIGNLKIHGGIQIGFNVSKPFLVKDLQGFKELEKELSEQNG